MFFLEPRPAQHLQKNTKKQVGNHPKILQKLCPEAFENRFRKSIPKNITKIEKTSKMCDLGVPKKQGRNEEMTNFSSLFRLRASLGHPGSPPGTEMVPRPPPRASGTPPGRQFFMISGQFLMPVFCSFCCFVGLSSMSLRHAETKNAVGTVAEIARRATGYSYLFCIFCSQAKLCPS